MSLSAIVRGRLNYYYAVVQRVLGLLLMIFSVSMLAPIVVALIYGDGEIEAFAIGFAITLATGLAAWLPSRHVQRELKIRDGFLVVVLFWMVLSLFGAIPLWLATRPDMSFTDAAFESVSGLTTTGATVLTGLDTLPHAILFWRVLLHWMGGMGIIVLAVAVLPMLGVGGMQLYRAETPGPDQGFQAHAAHPRDRQGAVVSVRLTHPVLRPAVLGRRDHAIRCRSAMLSRRSQPAVSPITTYRSAITTARSSNWRRSYRC